MPATKASPIANDTPHTGALLALAALATMAALLPGRAGVAAEPCEPSVGRIVSLQGLVEVQPAGAADWARAGLDDRLCIGDTIRAGAYSQAAVALVNDSVASLDQLTTMRFVGELTSVVRNPEGRIVEGAPHELKQQRDVWTFTRDMTSPNPNWLLTGTAG